MEPRPKPPSFLYSHFNAAAAGGFAHHQLFVDALAQFGHMGDNAHQTAALGQTLQRFQRFLHGLSVQRAEAFVNEHGVDLHAAGIALDHV